APRDLALREAPGDAPVTSGTEERDGMLLIGGVRGERVEPVLFGRREPHLVAAVDHGVGNEAANGVSKDALRRSIRTDQPVLRQSQNELRQSPIEEWYAALD